MEDEEKIKRTVLIVEMLSGRSCRASKDCLVSIFFFLYKDATFVTLINCKCTARNDPAVIHRQRAASDGEVRQR